MDTQQTINVMVVDDQRLLRDGLATLLALEPDIAIVGRAENGKEAIANFSRLNLLDTI